MSEEIKSHHLRALACDIEDCHNPQSWADYCRAAAAMLESKDARIAELEAALNDITARLLETFPGLRHLPPIQKARAALTGGKDE